jgi:hypothetical protein
METPLKAACKVAPIASPHTKARSKLVKNQAHWLRNISISL